MGPGPLNRPCVRGVAPPGRACQNPGKNSALQQAGRRAGPWPGLRAATRFARAANAGTAPTCVHSGCKGGSQGVKVAGTP